MPQNHTIQIYQKNVMTNDHTNYSYGIPVPHVSLLHAFQL